MKKNLGTVWDLEFCHLVFYLVNEANGVVNIVHVMYGGRDISKQFHDLWIKL